MNRDVSSYPLPPVLVIKPETGWHTPLPSGRMRLMKMVRKLMLFVLGAALLPHSSLAVAADISPAVRRIEPQVVAWRRDIHAHPELGNREHPSAAARNRL